MPRQRNRGVPHPPSLSTLRADGGWPHRVRELGFAQNRTALGAADLYFGEQACPEYRCGEACPHGLFCAVSGTLGPSR
jgi:hypothetical protein